MNHNGPKGLSFALSLNNYTVSIRSILVSGDSSTDEKNVL
jgi:hypothetical protein